MANRLGIDVRTVDAKRLMARLYRLSSTVGVSGPFPYAEDATYAQVWVETSMLESELDDWLYRVNHGCEYVGVFKLNS